MRRMARHYDLHTSWWFENRVAVLPVAEHEDSWGYAVFRRMVYNYVFREDSRRQKSREAGNENAGMELGHTHEAEIVSLLMRFLEVKMKAAVAELKDPNAHVDALRAVAAQEWVRLEGMVPAASFTLEKMATSNVQIVTNKRDRLREAEILDAVAWCVCPPSCEDLIVLISSGCGRFDDGLVAEAVQVWRTVFSRVHDTRVLFFTVAEMAIAVLFATLRTRGEFHHGELDWAIDICETSAPRIDGLVHFLGNV